MKHLTLSPDLKLPLDAVTQTFGILAVRGAGKSNLAAVMAEEMYAAGLPFVVVDPVGSWYGLRAAGAGGEGLHVPIFGGRHGDVPLERTGAHVIADLIVDSRVSCVLDVSEFSEGDKTKFLTDFAERLYRRNQEPLHLFLEEADDYIPQSPMGGTKGMMARCLGAWENIVRRGRARGIGLTLITQRSAVINKNVLTQIETLFSLRITSPQDRAAIEAWVKYHGQGKDVLESLSSLKDGEAWAWSPQWLKVMKRIQIRRRHTFDSGATPTMKGRRAATLADVDLGDIQQRMSDTIERAKENDPKELRAEIVRLQKQVESIKNETGAGLQPEEVQQLIQEARAEVAQQFIDRLRQWQGEKVALALRALVDASTANDVAEKRVHELSEQPITMESLVKKYAPQGNLTNISRLSHGERTPAAGKENTRNFLKKHEKNGKNSQDGTEGPLPKGEMAVLTVCGQYPAGATREQITILTGYKRSTRDAYLQRLREKEFVSESGGNMMILAAGMRALGPDFQPLPVGAALREYWMQRLPSGEGAILSYVMTAYPGSVSRDDLTTKTGYARSSRDAYIQRLGARRLVDATRDGVRASEVLFQ